MEIVRVEEGKYTRTATLVIDEVTLEAINEKLAESIVNGVKFTPLALEELWDILTKTVKASRYNEEYFVELEFYEGNMKLGSFVRTLINDLFEGMVGNVEESMDFYYDEFHP